MSTVPVNVWLDSSLPADAIGAVLYENVKEYEYFFYSIPDSFSALKADKYNCSSESIAEAIRQESQFNFFIAITAMPLDQTVVQSEDYNGVLISLFHDEEYENVRSIGELIYRSSIFKMDNVLPKPTIENLLNITLSETNQQTVGRIKYGETPEPAHILITHGIRTHATWTEEVRVALQKRNMSSSIIRYDWVDLFKFAFGYKSKRIYAERLLQSINSLHQEHPKKRLSIVVHSYGSIVLGLALEIAETIDNRIDIDAVILNGSILPQDYLWSRYTRRQKNHGVSIKRVLNICGDSDVWPVVANTSIRGAGSSGVFFFNDNYLNNVENIRFLDAGHSDILSVECANNIWGKYLLNPDYVPKSTAFKPKKWIVVADYFLRFIAPLVIILIACALLWYWRV